jgi:hypothetical protein
MNVVAAVLVGVPVRAAAARTKDTTIRDRVRVGKNASGCGWMGVVAPRIRSALSGFRPQTSVRGLNLNAV